MIFRSSYQVFKVIPWVLLSQLVVMPLAVEAEVLVLADGQAIEIAREVERQSGRLIYEDAQGVLRSVRNSNIDWEATEAARKPTPVPISEKDREPVTAVVAITQNDVAVFDGEEPAAATPTVEAVTVLDWTSSSEGDDVVVVANLSNASDESFVAIWVDAELLDADDEVLASTRVRVPEMAPDSLAEPRFRFVSPPPGFVGVRFELKPVRSAGSRVRTNGGSSSEDAEPPLGDGPDEEVSGGFL